MQIRNGWRAVPLSECETSYSGAWAFGGGVWERSGAATDVTVGTDVKSRDLALGHAQPRRVTRCERVTGGYT